MNYSVTVEDHDSWMPEIEKSFPSEEKAIQQAKQWAKDYSDKMVFISFHRSSDGQKGYINPDGAGITGKSWA